MVIDKDAFAKLLVQITPDAIPFLSGEIVFGQFRENKGLVRNVYEKARTSLSSEMRQKKDFLIRKALAYAETNPSDEPADADTIEKAQKVLKSHPHFRSIFNQSKESLSETIKKKNPEVERRITALNQFKRKDTYSSFVLLDHLHYLESHAVGYSHPIMKHYPRLIEEFKKNKAKNLTKIINANWSADKKLFAASVYERITGQTFPLADISDSLIKEGLETEQPLAMEDFPIIPTRKVGGDPHKKLREGILTKNFIMVREAIYQKANLHEKLPPFGWTPLHFAIATGDINIVYLLLQQGAYQPEAEKIPEESEPDEFLAYEETQKFLTHEATHETSTQFSPLELALKKQHYTIAAQLISAGAEVTQDQINRVEDKSRKAEMQKMANFRDLPCDPKSLKKTIFQNLPESLPFNREERTDLVLEGVTFYKELEKELSQVVLEANRNKKEEITRRNLNLKERIGATRSNPEIVEAFVLDSHRNVCFTKLQQIKFLTAGTFPNKHLIEHDTISQLYPRKIREFLEAILNQHGYRGCNEAFFLKSMDIGPTSPVMAEIGKGHYFKLLLKFNMEIIQKDDLNEFEVKVTTNYFLALGKKYASYPLSSFGGVEETYNYKKGKLTDYQAEKT